MILLAVRSCAADRVVVLDALYALRRQIYHSRGLPHLPPVPPRNAV